MPRSVESRWSEVTPVLVVDHMVGISLDVFRWLREGVGRDSLWHMLADSLWPRKAGRVQHGREEWRWLKLSFGRNSNGIKDLFCNRVGEWNPASFIPQRASTPILETGRYCICNKRWRESDPTMVECTNCDNWYHVECIREDVRRVEKNDRFMCPKCASNSHIKFPSLWCNSKSVASCHGITISTIVGNSAEFIPSTIEASKEENEIIENSCKDNVNVPVPTESHDFCENQEAELCITTVLGHNQSDYKSDILVQQSDRTQSEDFINQNVSSIGGGYCEVTDSDDDFKSPKKRVHATTTFPTWQKRKADTGDLHFENHLSESGTKKAINNGICPHDVDIGKKDDDLAEMLNAKYQDNGDHVVVTTAEGSVIIPKKFKFTLPTTKWESYKETRLTRHGNLVEGFRRGWLDQLRSEFDDKNLCCVFNFKRQHVNKGRFGNIYTGYGYCSHRSHCWKYVKVTGAKHPQKDKIVFTVRCEGTISHEKYAVKRNRIQAEIRQNIRKDLRYRQADSLATEIAGKAAPAFRRRCGNFSDVPTSDILRQIRSEVLKEHDLHQDPIIDLRERMKDDETLSNFIRGYSVKPLHVVMMLDAQLEILRLFKAAKLSVVLHVDATGRIIKNIDNVGLTQILLYSIVVKNPGTPGCPIAVCEFISNRHNTGAIGSGLAIFKDTANAYFKSNQRGITWFKRIETDFSLAMICATIQTFWPNMSLQEYLNLCWEETFHHHSPSEINIHVCRSHNMKTLTDRLRQDYGKESSCIKSLKLLLERYLFSTNIYECVFYVKKLLNITCASYITANVKMEFENLYIRAPLTVSCDNPINFQMYLSTHLTSSTVNKGSSFGKFFHDLCDVVKLNLEDFTGVNRSEINPYFNPVFVDYLCTSILPYTPLLTHIMFDLRGDMHIDDHQQPVEKWNDEVKNHLQCKEGKLKLSRYVKESMDVMIGRCVRFEADFHTHIGSLHKTVRKSAKRAKMRTDNSRNASNIKIDYQESWNKRGAQVSRKSNASAWLQDFPFISWGTFADDNGDFVFINTCSFDNIHTIILYILETSSTIRNFVTNLQGDKAEKFRNFITEMRNNQTNRGRQIWAQDLMSVVLKAKPLVNDMFNDEQASGIIPLAFMFDKYELQRQCNNCNLVESLSYNPTMIVEETVEEIVEVINTGSYQTRRRCSRCHQINIPFGSTKPQNGPIPFIGFHIKPHSTYSNSRNSRLEDIPRRILILGDEYDLVSCTLYQQQRNHFVAVIWYQNRWIRYDGLDTTIKYPDGIFQSYTGVSTVWYTLK